MVERTVLELLEEASSKASLGDLMGAVDSYGLAIDVDPSSASAWYGMGVMQAKRGNTVDAVAAFEKAHELNPNHGATSANLAVLLEGSDSVRASEMARMALETISDLEDLHRIASMHEADDELNLPTEETVEEVPMLEATAVEMPLLQSTAVLRDIREVISESQEMLNEGAFQEALDMIQPRLEGDASANHELWSICGICLSQLGNDEEAIQAIEYAISIGEDEAKMHFNLAQLLRKAGREDDAMQSLANALLSDPAHVNSLIARGEVFAYRGENDLAVQNWRRVIAIDPENSVSERLFQLEEEQMEESEDDEPDEARVEDHDDEEEELGISMVETSAYRVTKAQELTEGGDYVAAVNAWKELLQEDSQSAQIWNGLADALAVAGHIERSQQCRKRAEFIENGEQEALLESEAQSESDLIEAAIEAEERSSSRLPPSEEESVNVCIEWYNKGLTMLSEENGVEALNCFERAIGGAPREERELRIRAQNGRGHALYQLARYPDSIQAYHAAISMDPAGVTGKSLYNMGSSYAAVELYSDAIKCFEQALGRGLDDDDVSICKTQINRCKLLHKEQQKRQRQAT
ncbi:MAG: tetratricopeptide repeat protein [Candidatus Thalassarchaeaceae archaeon]|nr:tetratricopeptide repeat protein [Candidatus Thalassarchaeaceae archaeon]